MNPPTTSPYAELPELTRREKVFTMAGTLLGLLLAALDQTIVSTAGPLIQRDLRIEASLYVWITTAYLVASTVLVPVYGKLSDLFGRKRILLLGMGIFLAGSFLCGVAQNTLQLILFRAVQGAGSAALFTTAFAVVADIFPPAERGKYQGIFGAVFGLSSVVGPLVGGFITDHFGWHWTFFINMPIGAVALFFIVTRMPALRRPRAGAVSIDVAGALALVVAVVPFLLALSLGRGPHSTAAAGFPWGSWQIVAMFALAAAGLAAFAAIERRAAEPILDLRLFGNRAFAVGNAAGFVMGGVFLAAIVFLPLFMVNVVGLSATNSGLTTTPLTFGIVAGNVASGQLVSRIGRYKPLILASQAVLMVAFVVMGFTLRPDSTQSEVTLKMILVGLGLGPSIPLFTLAIQNSVAPRQIGVATSSATFFRQMGSTIGIALVGTVFATTLAANMRANVGAATAGAPASERARFEPGAAGEGGGGEEGGRARMSFDRASARRAVSEGFDRRRAQLVAGAPAGDPAAAAAALEGLERGRSAALATVDAIDAAMKRAFTDAIKQIYRLCILIALAGFLLTLALPELPLRRTMGDAPPPPVE